MSKRITITVKPGTLDRIKAIREHDPKFNVSAICQRALTYRVSELELLQSLTRPKSRL